MGQFQVGESFLGEGEQQQAEPESGGTMRKVRVGAAIRYRSSANRVFHGIVTAVSSQTVISLRIGNGDSKSVKTNVTKAITHTNGVADWTLEGQTHA